MIEMRNFFIMSTNKVVDPTLLHIQVKKAKLQILCMYISHSI